MGLLKFGLLKIVPLLNEFPLQNDKGQVPAEVVPDPMDMSLDKAEAAMVAKEMKQLLLDAVPLSCNLPRATLPNYDNIPGNLMLASLGLKLGDQVVLDDMKVRFYTIKAKPFFLSMQMLESVLMHRMWWS